MTWIVPWNGKDYDVDPSEFTGLELSLIKLRTGLSFMDLLGAIPAMDGDAIRAAFWVVDRRENQDLAFSDYAGPSVRVVMPHLPAFGVAVEALGKGLPDEPPGTDGSPSSTDSLGTTSTD